MVFMMVLILDKKTLKILAEVPDDEFEKMMNDMQFKKPDNVAGKNYQESIQYPSL